MTLRERLDAAIGPCLIPGGRERHLELVLAAVSQAPGALALPLAPDSGVAAPQGVLA